MGSRTVSAANTPCMMKVCSRCRMPPTSRFNPIIALRMIMTDEKTTSLARNFESGPPESIIDTISATSMDVTASANSEDPKGSPTRCAMVSA